jgi:hypothetical protein
MTPNAQNLTFLGRRIEREIGLLRTNFASSRGQTMLPKARGQTMLPDFFHYSCPNPA